MSPCRPKTSSPSPGVDPALLSTEGCHDNVVYRELEATAETLNTVIAAKRGATVSGRLFDSNGVLLATTIDTTPETVATTRVPDGLAPQATLTANGLTPGRTYLLEMTLGGSVAGATSTLVGLSAEGAGPAPG